MKKLSTVGIIVAVLVALTPNIGGATTIHAETGDAGDLPGSAQFTPGTGNLPGITGTLSSSGDADMFWIMITNPAMFSATTVGTPGTLFDSQLFLFTAAGLGVRANDDCPTGGFRSCIPMGSGPTTAGLYLLAISGFDRDPFSGGGLIFPSFPFTGIFGPTGPGGGSAITGWGGGGDLGTYQINLTGAAHAVDPIPEPTTLLLLGTGITGLLARRRMRRV